MKPGDKVVVYEHYTIRQLFEFMGVPEETFVLVNGEEKDRSTEVRDGDVIEKVPEPEIEPFVPDLVLSRERLKKEDKKTNILSDLNMGASSQEEDPLLAPVKPLPAWAADLPLDNPALHVNVPESAEMAEGSNSEEPIESHTEVTKSTSEQGIQIEVNGTKVTLLPKASHMFVDVFDAYPFDLTKAGGKKLISRVNGIEVIDFTTPIHAGDSVDLYWLK